MAGILVLVVCVPSRPRTYYLLLSFILKLLAHIFSSSNCSCATFSLLPPLHPAFENICVIYLVDKSIHLSALKFAPQRRCPLGRGSSMTSASRSPTQLSCCRPAACKARIEKAVGHVELGDKKLGLAYLTSRNTPII